jgi:hypothetical protein
MPYKPRSIDEEGIDPYLDRTADKHNGFGAHEFRILYRSGVNVTNLCRAMNVTSRDAVKGWIERIKRDTTSLES